MKKIPYENTFLTLQHYKEPLTEIKKGFGYYGALLGTIDGTKVQCHVCGKLFGEMSKHIFKHNLNTKQYRKKFQLAAKTSLISESVRQNRKMVMLKMLSRLTDEQKETWIERRRERFQSFLAMRRKTGWKYKMALETKNKRGTCPEQLLQKIRDCKKALGKVPSKNDFIDFCESQRFVHLIYITFGSWTKAVKMAGYKPRVNSNLRSPKPRHNREELLEYLQIFYQENQRPPTHTDCRRGLIPDASIYKRVFGSLPQARVEADLPEPLGRWGLLRSPQVTP